MHLAFWAKSTQLKFPLSSIHKTAEEFIEAEALMEKLPLDPLYTIFEKHLYDFNNNSESQQELIDTIVHDYLTFLRFNKVVIPKKFEPYIVEELREQVLQMLVKKTYGCLSKEEFLTKQEDIKIKKKTARKKYSKLF